MMVKVGIANSSYTASLSFHFHSQQLDKSASFHFHFSLSLSFLFTFILNSLIGPRQLDPDHLLAATRALVVMMVYSIE